MKKVVEVYGKTVESAIADAAVQLGVDREHLSYEILEEPKRGFLGFGEVPAKVRISYDTGDEDVAIDFVRLLRIWESTLWRRYPMSAAAS